MPTPIKILVVEDSEVDAELVVRHLRKAGFESKHRRVETQDQMKSALSEEDWDLIIADYNLPQFSAPDALNTLKASGKDLPFLVISGSMGEETAVTMMKAGAHDYLMKDNLTRLGPAVTRELREAKVRRERHDAIENIKSSLLEKEILLKEIHHRVKNNLQIIASMLRMQADASKDNAVLAQFKEAYSRIRSIALVHEKLYGSPSLADIPFDEYIHSIVADLARTYRMKNVFVDYDLNEVRLGIDVAIPCGLIVNELMTNILKHAFPEGQRGSVLLSLHETEDEMLVLVVHDDGVGIRDDIDILHSDTLGMVLITLLVQQIGGTIALDRQKGTSFTIKFKRQRQ